MHEVPEEDRVRGHGSEEESPSDSEALRGGSSRDFRSEAESFPEPYVAFRAGEEGLKLNGCSMRKVTGLKGFRRIVGMRWSWLGRETLDVPEYMFDALCIVAVSVSGRERVVALWC